MRAMAGGTLVEVSWKFVWRFGRVDTRRDALAGEEYGAESWPTLDSDGARAADVRRAGARRRGGRPPFSMRARSSCATTSLPALQRALRGRYPLATALPAARRQDGRDCRMRADTAVAHG